MRSLPATRLVTVTALLTALLLVPHAAPAYEAQDGAFLERYGGSGGRYATTGIHAGGDRELWSATGPGGLPLLGPVQRDRSGHVLAFQGTGSGLWRVVAFAEATGAMAWTSAGRAAEVDRDCVATAPDGTIWAQTADGEELLALDPANGSVTRTLPSPASDCDTGLQLLPDNQLAFVDFCCSDRLQVVDLGSGAARELPAGEAVASGLLLTSPDGRRAYVATDGGDPKLLSIDLASGAVLDRVELPGDGLPTEPLESAFVRPDGALFLVTAGEGEAIVRLDDDGTGQLTEAWSTRPLGDLGPRPGTLFPGGFRGELVIGWQAINGADTLLALDADDGMLEWRAPRRPGVSGGVAAHHALVDAAGHVVLPQVLERAAPEGEVLYDVWGPDGIPFGIAPPGLGSGVSGMVLGDNGTLTLLTTRGETPTLVAVAPGPGGRVEIATTVNPRVLGAGLVTLRVSGTLVAGALELVLRRGADTRRAPVAPTAARSPLDRRARFDLTGAAEGDWEVLVQTAAGALVPTGATVLVQPPDAEAQLVVDVDAPDGVRNGRSATVTVTVSNRSNIDADAVPLVLRATGLHEADPRRLEALFDAVHADGEHPPLVHQLGADARVALLALHTVPAGGTTALDFQLTVPADAPDAAELTIEVASAHCVTPQAAPAFAQADGDCFAEALDEVAADVAEFGAEGFAQCVALALAELGRPHIEDGMVVIPDGPGVSELAEVIRDCFLSAVGPDHPVLDIIEIEALSLQLATSYLDCELGAALGGDDEGDGHDAADITTGSSVDPNELRGPAGAGAARYLTAGGELEYRILFENLPAAAFAAQTVVITQTLDADLAGESFRLGSFGWGSLTVTPPPVADNYQTLVTVPGAEHRVRLTFTRSGAELRWVFETLSLTADGPPADDTIGFLPPNATPPEGDGFVSYQVAPAAGVADGTVVEASASIVFDTNAPIVTNTWSNTFDLAPPATTLEAVATPSPNNTVHLTWSGADAVSGVTSYLVEQLAPQPRILTARLTEPSLDVVGSRGETLMVRVRAVDGAGNVEPAATAPVATVAIAGDALDRMAGDNRILTAIELSRQLFATSGAVVLARQDTYPDSLAGATVAHDLGAPILLTHSDTLPAEVAAEIARLGARSAVVLGGQAAISDAVAEQLRALGLVVERVAASNRYGTAAAIAAALGAAEHAFVAEGAHADPSRGWPSALLVAPWAAQAGEPLLLVEADRLPPETAQAITDLGVERVTIVGSSDEVSAAVEAELAALGVTVERVAGADRYLTGLAVAAAADAAGVGSHAATWLATGRVFADALSAGAAVAATGGRLLLVDGQDPAASQSVLDAIAADRSAIAILRLVGGPAAITPETESRIRAALAAPR